MSLARSLARPLLVAAVLACPTTALSDGGGDSWDSSSFPGDAGASQSRAAPPKPLPNVRAGERPDPGTIEGGLWMMMDEAEAKLRRSGRVVHDPALRAYLQSILCRLDAEICNDVRIYLVRNPAFNANMAPNGTMQVWTGLLLRTDNEAQLAFVLAHELAHYLRRHSLQRWRNMYETSTGLLFVQVLTAAAGVGFVGDIAQIVGHASLFAYSRDQEREADIVGFQMMLDAGYQPDQAAQIWVNLIAERASDEDKDKDLFFATHPTEDERVDTLLQKAESSSGIAGNRLGEDAHEKATAAHNKAWGVDELRRRKLQQSEVLFERMVKQGRLAGLSHYYLAEANRLQATEDAEAEAFNLFEQALATGNAPPETHRSLGLLHWQRGDDRKAADAFRTYLASAADADDREMIQSYIEELE